MDQTYPQWGGLEVDDRAIFAVLLRDEQDDDDEEDEEKEHDSDDEDGDEGYSE